jgi:ribosome-associated translation inhibitor RaiA
MIDQASIISLCSAGVVVVSMWKINTYTIQNLKESLKEFKTDVHVEIEKEKAHAMELAGQRFKSIEKNVDEIFPRLRNNEDKTKHNCFAVESIQKSCIKHREEKGL